MADKHYKKFQNGMVTAREFHENFFLDAGVRCVGCGGRPLTMIAVFADEKTMLKRDPDLVILRMSDPGRYAAMRHIPTDGNPLLRISKNYFCSKCTPAAEKAAAHHPDWCYVEIDRGPNPNERIVVQRA